MNPYSSDYSKQPPRSTQQTGMYEVPSQQQGLPPLPNSNNNAYDPYSYGAGYYNSNSDEYNGYDTVNYDSNYGEQQQHQHQQQQEFGSTPHHYDINQQQQQQSPPPQQQQQEQQSPLTPEQLTRKRFALTNILLLILSILLVVGCVLSTIIRALDLSGVKSIVSLIFSALLNLAVIVVCLVGIVSSLLNKPGQEQLRYKTTMINMIGLVAICALETFYLIISNILVPLLGIAMFFIGMIFVVVFYGPCIAVAVYRYMLMRRIPGAIPPANSPGGAIHLQQNDEEGFHQ